jgi:hypothetical protein
MGVQYVTAIYEHAETYSTMWSFFMKHCLSSAIAAYQRHMQPNDFADETMVHSYVSTDTIESAFGKLDQTNEQSQRIDVWKNFGQVLCDGSGLF